MTGWMNDKDPWWATDTGRRLRVAEIEHWANKTGELVIDLGALERLTYSQVDQLWVNLRWAPSVLAEEYRLWD